MLEDKLNQFNIFSLRDLARNTGVKSPTSKTKKVLIKEIIEIMSGEKRPVDKGKKQGRPPKTFGYNLANVFDIEESANLNRVCLKQETASFGVDATEKIAGILELVNNGAGLLWVLDDGKFEHYFISNEILQNLNVKMGDQIIAETFGDSSQKVVKSIFSINNIPYSSFSDRTETMKNCVVPSKNIEFENDKFDKLGLMLGENCYIYGGNNNDNTSIAVEMLNFAKVQNKIYINISLADKNKIYLQGLTECEKFVMDLAESVDLSRRVVLLAIERAKRLFENGENVLIVVDDLLSIDGVDNEQQNLVKNLVSLAKADLKNGSITLFSIMPNNDMKVVEKLADKRLQISNKEISKL